MTRELQVLHCEMLCEKEEPHTIYVAHQPVILSTQKEASMEKDLGLLLAGALISLISSLLSGIIAHRLGRSLWIEQEQRKEQEKRREEIGGTTEELKTLIEALRQLSGPQRGESSLQVNALLPAAIAKLEVDTQGVIAALEKKGSCILIGDLLQTALEAPDAN
jgi:hypothetical protein